MKFCKILITLLLSAPNFLCAQKLFMEETPSSDHLVVKGNLITVKNWGVKFDGEYDVIKLAKDSCVDGNCFDGKGRKVLAKIVNGNPRIRIMEGKFKNATFLGEGVMLIDGEGKVLDGTYELGKFKVNYKHNSLSSKTVFHSKFTKEDVGGNYTGYSDYGIGSATDEYRKFVVCDFIPEYHEKPVPITVWEKDIFSPAYNKWQNEYTNSPSFLAERAKIHAKYGIKDDAPISDNTKIYIFKSQCNSGGKMFYVISKISADISKYPFDQIKNEATTAIQRNGWVLYSALDYLGVSEDVKIQGKAGKDYAVSESSLYTIKKN